MNDQLQALYLLRKEISKAESSLWTRHDTIEAQAALGRCLRHLNYRNIECLPEVQTDLENADAALLGKGNTFNTRSAIRRASFYVLALIKEMATSPKVA